MLYQIIGVTLSLLVSVSADCQFISGNYYCSETSAVTYSNVGLSSSYQDVISMDESSCVCQQQAYNFGGNLAPFDEELSVHFRGPLRLSQFAVYYPQSSNSKRDLSEQENCDSIVSKPLHKHKRDVAVEVVEVTETVLIDENGNTVTHSATVETAVEATPTTAAATPDAATTPIDTTTTLSSTSSPSSPTSSSSTGAAATSTSSATSSGSDWYRSAYFVPGSADGCTFMNHQGGTAGSGIWSSCFGNSISFANSDGITGAGSPQPLGDVTIESGKEYMIFSSTQCSGNNAECGFYREGIPAYQGFAGNQKIFYFEFSMPSDTNGNGYNQDMPAIWLLNAKIPRTLQYGQSTCSCWATGCGELDLFEVLSPGSDKMITHIHDGQGGGTQDYFKRPTDGVFRAVVIFNGSDKTIHLVQVDSAPSSGISNEQVQTWLNQQGSAAVLP
ncbi:Protein TOS1 [Nakaseomyces bracarensis]|uniref:glucan endo-1,3-beta-D-glucosidase n=1 Tax=Nakaseomyces bracarensis TaxID=273131 RepID=A0ABR4P175_9SACH